MPPRLTLDLDFDNQLRLGARLTPLWLVGDPTGGRALEVCTTPSLSLSGTLGAWCGEVDAVDGSEEHRTLAGLAAFPEARYDLVTAYGLAPSSRVLSGLLRVMRPGGRLYVAVRARWWYGRLRRSGVAEPSVTSASSAGNVGGPWLGRRLTRAGFRVVARFAAAPSLERPRLFVPATRSGVASLGRVTREEGLRDHVWSTLARGGLHHVLLPVTVYVVEA